MQAQRARKAIAVLLAAAAALAGLYLLRPPCLILRATGFTCAGCGTQRMVSALLRGDVAGAFGYNPFMFLCLPAAGLYVLWEACRYVRGQSPLYRKKGTQAVFAVVLVLAAVFTVWRNLQL